MDLPSHELQAFRTVAQTLSFSQAAERIHITQPALSQRIQSLEKSLGLTLFLRDPKGIKLTEAGLRLLRYCQIKDHLESELLSDLVTAPDGKLGGRLTIAGYSSVLHSVIIPALAPLLRDNPAVQFAFRICQTDELIGMLERAEADFIVLDRTIEKSNIRNLQLGEEKYVLIQSKNFPVRDRYLDHDPTDRVTELFFKTQGAETPSFQRSYVEDIEGILQGVALGLGQGVVPRHLLSDTLPVRIAKGMKTMKMPVLLHYFRQSYYSNLQKTVIETLKLNCKEYLR
ncbi:MAG: LysR family transcriptional regulator [Candidatus Obscuribacterales bacterium]|nr:LysR family transcriptional regulator [Candidatus Obscuribacterales bacterium]